MEDFKNEIHNYKASLASDKSKWFIEQIKHGILMGQSGLRVCVIPKKSYKKAKHLFNFWKNVDDKYYFQELNIIIVDEKIRKIIDFIKALGFGWFISFEWNNSSFSQREYTLYVKLY